MRRSIEEELVDVVSAALPTADDLSPDITGDLAQMAFMTDAELWQAAQTELPLQDSEKLDQFQTSFAALTGARPRTESAKRLWCRLLNTVVGPHLGRFCIETRPEGQQKCSQRARASNVTFRRNLKL